MVVLSKRFLVLTGVISVLLPLASCANSPLAGSLERSLAPDPQLLNSPTPSPGASPPTDIAQTSPTPEASPTPESIASPSPDPGLSDRVPQPGDPDFIGPVLPASAPIATGETPPDQAIASAPAQFSDVDQAPEELRSHIQDLATLGVLNVGSSTGQNAASQFEPNQTITRREFARWLVAANNVMYGDRPAQKIRLGVASDQPAFKDVPPSDPDFAAVQGLAEAGLIPSSLSGDATTVNFRPDAPLTRENLILWKVPIDLRGTLPNATVEAVQQSWGFQDAGRINPRSLRAVLADYQNGDLSNIRRAFGYTTLFQPAKPVTRAEAASVLWFFGSQGEGISAKDILQSQPQGSSASPS